MTDKIILFYLCIRACITVIINNSSVHTGFYFNILADLDMSIPSATTIFKCH